MGYSRFTLNPDDERNLTANTLDLMNRSIVAGQKYASYAHRRRVFRLFKSQQIQYRC